MKKIVLTGSVSFLLLFTMLSSRFDVSVALEHKTTVARWAVIEDVNGDLIGVKTLSDEDWTLLVQLYHDRSRWWIGGIVEIYDNKWGFRFDPDTIIIAEFVIEEMQSTIGLISQYLPYWLGRMAAVGAMVVGINQIRVPQSIYTIRKAVDVANQLDTIFVSSGTYYEHVVINKSVSLVGEERETTIIDGKGTFVTILHVMANNVTITGFTIQNDAPIHCLEGGGIYITNSTKTSVVNNTITHNQYPINLRNSENNIIIGNTIIENDVGIQFLDQNSRNNTVYHNNFINNSLQVSNFNASNTWDNGCEGNYWNNYNGTDIDGDSIGDTGLPWEGVDYYPLMNPYWNPADVNHDLEVDIYDVVLVCAAYDCTPSDCNWNPHCDITEPYGIINIYDVVIVCVNYGETYP